MRIEKVEQVLHYVKPSDSKEPPDSSECARCRASPATEFLLCDEDHLSTGGHLLYY